MPEVQGVWGIDIGLAGLKAIRLVYTEAAKQVLATAFDYVPHPKILSQPDANPDELIAQALDTFLSRNKLQGDGVAIGVPGQTALARFIQLPPVEASKVGEIVKYEARQQIPFALDEVIWDYQPLGGGTEESGFMLDAEVGLFAMKRDQVQQHLSPFVERKVEVDLIQIAPLALYNFLCHDRFGYLPSAGAPIEQDDYTLLLDMGADNTTLLVSNGKKIWNRNVPLGGNHFTRALTKEMKLTFAKAEHLKCNATKSPDPKAVFQALRPVFNDYVAEIQRSIGFFSSVNRDAKIGRIVGVGNGFKLAGLQKFLQQNLQMDVERADTFQALAGDTVLNAPLFQENQLSFAVPYGLALQGLKLTRVHTSLLPPEITMARMVRRKKPWAVAAAALLLLGLAISTTGYANVWRTVSRERFGSAEERAKSVVETKKSAKTKYDGSKATNEKYRKDLQELLISGAERTPWLEVYKAIDECLPTATTLEEQREDDPRKQNQIRILSITAQKYDDLGTWHKGLDDERQKSYMRPDDRKTAPTGAGYVFTLQCRHFHHDQNDVRMQGTNYAQETFLKELKRWEVPQFDVVNLQPTGVMIPVRKMGIICPTISKSEPEHDVIWYKNGPSAGPMNAGAGAAMPAMRGGAGMAVPPGRMGAGMGGQMGMAGFGGGRKGLRSRPAAAKKKKQAEESEVDQGTPIRSTDFEIQFAWKVTPPSERKDVDPMAEDKDVIANLAPLAPLGGPNTPPRPPGATQTPAPGNPATPNQAPPSAPAPGNQPKPN